MVKSIYRRQYDLLLKDLIDEFKEMINNKTPTEFRSLSDIFSSDPKARQVKDYLLKCSAEHCPQMNPLFVDIYLAIYYNTNEPIDGNLLRMTLGFSVLQENVHVNGCVPRVSQCNSIGCLACHPEIRILNKAKKDVDYCRLYTVVCATNEPFDLVTPCVINNLHQFNIDKYGYPQRNDRLYSNVAITLYAVRPEFIKFAINNINLVLDKTANNGGPYSYFSKYVEYYQYLENCMHPDKLGTVNFIIEPQIQKFDLESLIIKMSNQIDFLQKNMKGEINDLEGEMSLQIENMYDETLVHINALHEVMNNVLKEVNSNTKKIDSIVESFDKYEAEHKITDSRFKYLLSLK
jgi:hypothetical protein